MVATILIQKEQVMVAMVTFMLDGWRIHHGLHSFTYKIIFSSDNSCIFCCASVRWKFVSKKHLTDSQNLSSTIDGILRRHNLVELSIMSIKCREKEGRFSFFSWIKLQRETFYVQPILHKMICKFWFLCPFHNCKPILEDDQFKIK
jgi:hypothetical protein